MEKRQKVHEQEWEQYRDRTNPKIILLINATNMRFPLDILKNACACEVT